MIVGRRVTCNTTGIPNHPSNMMHLWQGTWKIRFLLKGLHCQVPWQRGKGPCIPHMFPPQPPPPNVFPGLSGALGPSQVLVAIGAGVGVTPFLSLLSTFLVQLGGNPYDLTSKSPYCGWTKSCTTQETMRNLCLLAFTGESPIRGFLGGAGCCPSTVWMSFLSAPPFGLVLKGLMGNHHLRGAPMLTYTYISLCGTGFANYSSFLWMGSCLKGKRF